MPGRTVDVRCCLHFPSRPSSLSPAWSSSQAQRPSPSSPPLTPLLSAPPAATIGPDPCSILCRPSVVSRWPVPPPRGSLSPGCPDGRSAALPPLAVGTPLLSHHCRASQSGLQPVLCPEAGPMILSTPQLVPAALTLPSQIHCLVSISS